MKNIPARVIRKVNSFTGKEYDLYVYKYGNYYVHVRELFGAWEVKPIIMNGFLAHYEKTIEVETFSEAEEIAQGYWLEKRILDSL